MTHDDSCIIINISAFNFVALLSCALQKNTELLNPIKSELLLLAAVDDDIFGANAPFQHAHLRVVSSTSEKPGRLNPEVSDALLVVVHHAVAVLIHQPLVLVFDFLKNVSVCLTLSHSLMLQARYKWNYSRERLHEKFGICENLVNSKK